MSRIGKKPIELNDKTTVTAADGVITVKGPLGELKRDYKDSLVEIKVEGNIVTLSPKNSSNEANVFWGTYGAHLNNMIQGVNEEYKKELEIEGVGYRAEMKGDELVLSVGFSHTVPMKAPEGVKVSVEKNKITVSGMDKDAVGQFAADVRATKKPEPYKGKGIHYVGEFIRRKEGKKAV